MALTAISVAYPLAPVGADSVGGAEQVLSMIDRALVAAGHRSIVVACEGSRVEGELVEVPRRRGPLTDEVRRRAQADTLNALEALLRRERPDVVHFHGIDFTAYLPEQRVPAIATLHLPPSWYPAGVFGLPAQGVLLLCVSESQRQACPPGAEIAAVIPNGVRLDALAPAGARRRRILLAMGRICPEKGFHHALDAAKEADAPLLLAGEVFGYQAHQDYFRNELLPRLDRRRRFIGPVGWERKRRLLAGARAVLIPSLAPETSSLVAMEALACGAPVIAFRAGALPEIVEHGVTGFVVDDAGQMAEAIDLLDAIEPARCRRAAEMRFSAETMTGRYLALYERIASKRAPAQPSPETELRLEHSTRLADLEALRPGWEGLWGSDPGSSPFLHPDWVIPWCRHFGRERVEVFSAWRGDRLVGLAPMEVWTEGGSRTLKLLGGGISDQLDVLTEPRHDEEIRAAFLARFTHGAGRWDRCLLEPLPEHSPWVDRSGAVERIDVSPMLELPARIEDLPRVVPARVLSNLRTMRRRLEQSGPLRLGTATEPEVDGWMGALFELHRARWRTRGGDGVLSDPKVVAFHREVARGFSRAGLLRLHALFHGERLFAVLYGFASRGQVQFYLSGFDPSYEKSSPGSLVLGSAVEEAIRRGERRFDFLRGSEPYKYAWGARDRGLWRRWLEVRS